MTITYKRKCGANGHEEGKGKEVKKHRRRTFTATSINEKPQVKDFWRTTWRNLKRIEKKYLRSSIEDLEKESKNIYLVKDLKFINSNMIFLDKEGKPLLYFLKGAIKWPFDEYDPSFKELQALENLAEVYPPPPPKSTDVRHNAAKQHPKTHGVYHIALWHAKGQENNAKNKEQLTKGAVISPNVISVGYKFNAVSEFLHKFTHTTQAIGTLFEVIDKDSYERYREKFQNMAKDTTTSLLKTSDKSCFFGMAVLVGLACKSHRDSKDTKDGWVADMAYGNFSGGHMEVPQLGCKFNLRQGDVIFMRLALLQHSVSKVTGGLRYGVVYFSHQSLMR